LHTYPCAPHRAPYDGNTTSLHTIPEAAFEGNASNVDRDFI